MNFKSKAATLNTPQKTAFEFLANFNNFEKLMPDQVKNWQSTTDRCSFTIEGMADLTLIYSEKKPSSYLKVEPEGKSPIKFDLNIHLEADEDNDQQSTGVVEINASLNPMLAMVAKRPLENLVTIMADKLKRIFP